MLGANKLQLETEGVTVHDSAINFITGSFTRGSPVLLNVVRLLGQLKDPFNKPGGSEASHEVLLLLPRAHRRGTRNE